MSVEDVAPYPYQCPLTQDGAHLFKRMAAKEWEPQTMTVWCVACGGLRRLPLDGIIAPLDETSSALALDEVERRIYGLGS